MLYECASIHCPADYYFSCPDNTCRGEISQCNYPLSTKIFKRQKLVASDRLSKKNLNDINEKTLGYILIAQKMIFYVEGLALSDISDTKLQFDPKYKAVFYNFLSLPPNDIPPVKFIRSGVLKVSTSLNSFSINEYQKPVKLYLFYDALIPHYKYKHGKNEVSVNVI